MFEKSKIAHTNAQRYLPGGVNSPVRAYSKLCCFSYCVLICIALVNGDVVFIRYFLMLITYPTVLLFPYIIFLM